MQNKPIKMRVVDWFEDAHDHVRVSSEEENFNNHALIRILRKKFKIEFSQKPDFVIFSNYFLGNKMHFLEYDCVRIFSGMENIRADYNFADYAIDADFIDFGDRHLRLPLFAFVNFHKGSSGFEYDFTRRNLSKREKFCAFITSNGGNIYTKMRDDFFEKLSKYKRVDSGGHYKNNIGGSIDKKIKWLENYKFNICFENSSFPGYLTEKLFDAYQAGCVPIYWGDTSLRVGADNAKLRFDLNDANSIDQRIPQIPPHLIDYHLNPKAFINAHDFPNLDALLEEVKRIDNDDKAYEAMRNEPLFLGDFDFKTFYEKRVLDFFERIFEQGPILSARRGRGQRLQWYEDEIRTAFQKLDELRTASQKSSENLNLTKDALNVAKFISKIQRKIKKMRFWKSF